LDRIAREDWSLVDDRYLSRALRDIVPLLRLVQAVKLALA